MLMCGIEPINPLARLALPAPLALLALLALLARLARLAYLPTALIVPPTANGCGGALPAMFCQITRPVSAANARVPVEPTFCGTAVA